MHPTVAILAVFLTLASIKTVGCCVCMPTHPQTAFCKTDFVIKARILSNQIVKTNHTNDNFLKLGIPMPHHIVYKTLINSVLKGLKLRHRWNLHESTSIYIPVHESSCGLQLEIGKHYLLTGKFVNGKFQMNSCDFNMKWGQLSAEMIEGMRGKYDCGCKIASCINGYCNELNGCKWNVMWDKPFEDCFYKHLSCESVGRNFCKWNKKATYNKCLITEKRSLPVRREVVERY